MFPDSANVAHIRDALWRHKALGSASVMVGAGFSRNADSTSASVRPMPSWSDMAHALALAMKNAGYGDNQAVSKWLDAAINDPLPEIRNAAVVADSPDF